MRFVMFCRQSKAFTLLESIIAMALLVLSLGAGLASMTVARRSIATSENRMEALHTARGVLERLRTHPWNAAALQPGTHSIYTNSFVGFYTVTAQGNKLRDVSIHLDWLNQWGNSTETIVLDTTLTSSLR